MQERGAFMSEKIKPFLSDSDSTRKFSTGSIHAFSLHMIRPTSISKALAPRLTSMNPPVHQVAAGSFTPSHYNHGTESSMLINNGHHAALPP